MLGFKHSSRWSSDRSSPSDWNHVGDKRLHLYSPFPVNESPKSVCQIWCGPGRTHRSKSCAVTVTKESFRISLVLGFRVEKNIDSDLSA